MDDSSSSSPSERRLPQREVLLRRLALVLEEMRRAGMRPPAALEALVQRGSAGLRPGR